MPAPLNYFYETAILVSAHQVVLDAIDAGTGPGKFRFYAENDTLLAEVTMTDPAGTIDPGTGQLTLTPAGAGTAVADGICTYGTVTDSDNTVVVTLPTEAGTTPVPGKIVINSTSIVNGASVTVTSATIG